MDKNNLNDLVILSKKILKVFYILLIILGTYICLKIIDSLNIIKIFLSILSILSPLFIGIVIAWLFNPFVKWLESKKIKRFWGSIISYAILILCIIILINAIIPTLYNQTLDLVENFPQIFSSVKNWITNLFKNVKYDTLNIETFEKNLMLKLDEYSLNLSTSIPTIIIGLISSIFSYIGSFIIGLVIGFFLLISCNNLGNFLSEVAPKKIKNNLFEICELIDNSLRKYVNGALIDSFIVFIICTITFSILGLKSAILFGIFCGITNVIPYAGPYIGGIPAVIVGFSQSPTIGIAILIAIIIIQVIEGNILQALIMSKTTKLHPVTIIIGLLIFGYFFGIIGMLLSTPIIGVIKVIIKYIDKKYKILNFEWE